MNMKRIRSKIEEGSLTEKKLEHREPKCQTKQKPNKNYVLPNKVICFTKQNTDFFIRRARSQNAKQKLCFTKQSKDSAPLPSTTPTRTECVFCTFLILPVCTTGWWWLSFWVPLLAALSLLHFEQGCSTELFI